MNYTDTDRKLADNIRKLRNTCGFTQEQVSAKLGVIGVNMSRSKYAKIESNCAIVRVRELVALKLVFKCSFDDFFDGLEESFQSEILEMENTDPRYDEHS